MADIMYEKAQQAQLCLKSLSQELHIETTFSPVFCVNRRDRALLNAACVMHNPFQGLSWADMKAKRKEAVRTIFHKEEVLQTGPAAAVIALDAMLAQEIGLTRNGHCDRREILCDVAIAGLHMSRLYMCANIGNEAFCKSRIISNQKMHDPLNGQYFRYRTKDKMWFAPYVFSNEQRVRFLELLFNNPDNKLPVTNSQKAVEKAFSQWNSFELEKALEEAGLGGYRLRTREEWENTSPGAQLKDSPLVKVEKVRPGLGKSFGKMDAKHGPLSGIRVLDLTVGLAGPTCTRILAEQGAEVLMVRREQLSDQEHSMLELDGWAGKKHLNLDFHDPDHWEKMHTLVRQADIVVTSYRAGALEAAGLSEERVHALNPDVIYAKEIFLADSEWKNRPGGASAAEDLTGISIRNGSAKQPKHLSGFPVAYLSGMILAAGVMQAIQLQMTEGGSYSVTGSLTSTAQWLHRCSDVWEKMAKGEHVGKTAGKGRTLKRHRKLKAAKPLQTESRTEDLQTEELQSEELQSEQPQSKESQSVNLQSKEEDSEAPSSVICTDYQKDNWTRIYQKVAWTAVGDVFFLAPAACCGELNYPLRNMRFVEEKEGFFSSR